MNTYGMNWKAKYTPGILTLHQSDLTKAPVAEGAQILKPWE